MKKLILLLISMLTLTGIVNAATIEGKIYDFSLNKINNIVVEINTEPAQRYIVTDSTYKFNAPPGSYTITAKTLRGKILTSEEINVRSEGEYNLDLITFIDIEEEQELLNDTELDITSGLEAIEEKSNKMLIIMIILVLTALVVFYLYKKRNRKEIEPDETDLANKVIEIIKKEGGRTTQKQIRKAIPYSEAKISLIITELEAKGKIEKIKKGRSNVIILKNN